MARLVGNGTRLHYRTYPKERFPLPIEVGSNMSHPSDLNNSRTRTLIFETIILVFWLWTERCHGWMGFDRADRRNPFHTSGVTNNHKRLRVGSELFGKLEIWWDGRGETRVPPTLLFEEIGGSADRWILNGNDTSSHWNVSNLEIFQVEGNKLKEPKDPKIAGSVVQLRDSSDQENALEALGSVEWILIEVDSYDSTWQMIPAENLIAAAQSTGTKLAFVVSKASDVAGLSKALELGVDALCISTKNGDDDQDLWKTAFQAREERNAEAAKESVMEEEPQITTGKCWRRGTTGTIVADRICVDLVQNLSADEGCWVGSSAKIMTLVLSEAASSQYVPTRPFRVNAGPVHSYILMGDGLSTKYLCELKPSDQVMVYNTQTNSSRAVAVGRLKEEVRPCVLIELERQLQENDSTNEKSSSRTSGQVFLQQAETVRLGAPSGGFVRVTDLEAQREGTREDNPEKENVFLRVMTTGTHVGRIYSGKVRER